MLPILLAFFLILFYDAYNAHSIESLLISKKNIHKIVCMYVVKVCEKLLTQHTLLCILSHNLDNAISYRLGNVM